jgi:hypothetical protein
MARRTPPADRRAAALAELGISLRPGKSTIRVEVDGHLVELTATVEPIVRPADLADLRRQALEHVERSIADRGYWPISSELRCGAHTDKKEPWSLRRGSSCSKGIAGVVVYKGFDWEAYKAAGGGNVPQVVRFHFACSVHLEKWGLAQGTDLIAIVRIDRAEVAKARDRGVAERDLRQWHPLSPEYRGKVRLVGRAA